jgi:cobalt/nickel transport protein
MKKQIVSWLAVSLVIGGFISLFASSSPDGFEKAGEEVGYIEHASASVIPSPMPDYAIPGLESWVSSSLAGLVGVALTFAVFLVIGKLVTGRNQ